MDGAGDIKLDDAPSLVDKLPNEILVKIFKDVPNSLNTISSVYQRWNRIVNELIGRTMFVHYINWNNLTDDDRSRIEEYFLETLFSERVGFQAVKFCARRPFHLQDHLILPGIPSDLPYLESWIAKHVGKEDEDINKVYDGLWRRTLVCLKEITVLGSLTPGLLSILMKIGSHITKLTLTSQSLASFPSTGEGSFKPRLNFLKELWLQINYRSNIEQQGTLAFLHDCHFPSLFGFKLSLFSTSYASAWQMLRLWEEIFGFIWNHALKDLQVMFKWLDYHNQDDDDSDDDEEETPNARLSREELKRFDQLLITVSSFRPCPTLRNICIVDMSKSTDRVEGRRIFFCDVWLPFVANRINLEQLALDMKKCTPAEIGKICENNKDTLKKFAVCRLALPIIDDDSEEELPVFDCGMLGQCQLLDEIRLKFFKTGQRSSYFILKSATSLPPSLERVFLEGCYIASKDVHYIATELPKLEEVYLGKIRVGNPELYGRGLEGCEEYGVDEDSLNSFIESKRITKIWLTEAVAFKPSSLPEVLKKVMNPNGYYDKPGFPEFLRLQLNQDKTEYIRSEARMPDHFDASEDWNRLV